MMVSIAWWDEMIAAGQEVAGSLASFVFSMGFVAAFFIIVLGAIFYFTGYSGRAGKSMLINGILLCVVLSVLYIGLFNTLGPPDISGFFTLPGTR